MNLYKVHGSLGLTWLCSFPVDRQQHLVASLSWRMNRDRLSGGEQPTVNIGSDSEVFIHLLSHSLNHSVFDVLLIKYGFATVLVGGGFSGS